MESAVNDESFSVFCRVSLANTAGESFNGKFRDECLCLEWFRNRIDAKIVIEDWRRHYNETRPHSSPGYLTPAEFKQLNSETNPEETIFQV